MPYLIDVIGKSAPLSGEAEEEWIWEKGEVEEIYWEEGREGKLWSGRNVRKERSVGLTGNGSWGQRRLPRVFCCRGVK